MSGLQTRVFTSPTRLGVSSSKLVNWLYGHLAKYLLFKFFLIYSYVHTMFGPVLLHIPCSLSLPPHLPLLSGRNFSALISNFAEERV
jgi:hypothetical protein